MNKPRPKPNCVVHDDTHDWGGQSPDNVVACSQEYGASMTTVKSPFQNSVELHTEVVNGKCPRCRENAIFIGLRHHIYKCTTCGSELEQKVNGVISYIPAVAAGGKIPTMQVVKDPNVPQKS